MLKPPPNTEIVNLPTAIIWFDDDDEFVCAVSKQETERTPEVIQETLEGLKKLIGDKKVCLLIDVTHISEISREGRDLLAKEFPRFIKAVSVISGSAFGKMVANIFFTIKKQPYPIKMFNDDKKAREWLKQHV